MKRNKNKKGFTIVELVIVIGVIGILSAILIPTFVNLTDKANKAALKSNLANAYSLYAAEAADHTYEVVDPSTGAVTATYTIDFKGQDEVALKDKDGQYFFYVNNEWDTEPQSSVTGYTILTGTKKGSESTTKTDFDFGGYTVYLKDNA